MVDIPQFEPDRITAGDLIQWTRDFADYPAPTWVLSYVLLNSTGKITITGTADGTRHLISVPAATSAAWTPGIYRFQAYVTSGTSRYQVRDGSIEVLPNFATATTSDTRSTARKTLEAIEAEILARASGGASVEYTIAGRSLKREPLAELIKLRDRYAAMVRSEEAADRIARGLGTKNKILVRF